MNTPLPHLQTFGTLVLAVLFLSQAQAANDGKPSGTGKPIGGTGDCFLPPAALVHGSLSDGSYPLTGEINTFLKRQPEISITPTGLVRNDYLRVIDGQVRAMRQYQNAEGRIIDPVAKREIFYATPCYAHAVAALAASGFDRDPALLESGMKAMDVVTKDMASGKCPNGTGDFYIYPMMMALPLYEKVTSSEKIETWREKLRQIDPLKAYRAHANGNNWATVNLSGDWLRASAGLTTADYAEKTLVPQLGNFTPMGMYREYGNSLTYDHFARHYIGGMMQQGYRGRSFERSSDLIWRGAWTSLFMMSPTGEAPTGFRSTQHIWNEAQSCVTYEIYATQYAKAGRAAEAGAFKRAAALSLRSITEWLRPDGSGYIVKNRYPIEARHGYEWYSEHTVYNLIACSMLAQAWQFADESITERPAPCDVGGYVIPILAFNKIFASAGGTYLEYGTCADHGITRYRLHDYDPTGILRIHVKDGNPQLGPSDGCGPAFSGKDVYVAVGPLWQDSAGVWRSLSKMTPSVPNVEILDQKMDRTEFRVTFSGLLGKGKSGPGVAVTETITVEPSGVTVQDEIKGDGVKAMRVCYPMLVFDGLEKTQIQLKQNALEVKLKGKGVKFEVLEPAGTTLMRSGKELNHRNGIIEPVYADIAGRKAVYRIQAFKGNP